MEDTEPVQADLFASIFDGLPAPDVDVDVKADFFDFLGSAHMIVILHCFAVEPGPWRFSELREYLDVPPTTLTDRLQELTAAGLLSRQSYDEIPPRVEYTATEKARDLKPAFRCLSLWVDHHEWDR